MTKQVSRKITCLQFVCSLMIIALHTAFAEYFPGAPAWAVELNRFWRSLVDVSISTFFFLSAYLFYRRADERRYAEVLRQKFFSLVVPYLMWNALFYAQELLREYLTWGTFLQPVDAWTVIRHLTWDVSMAVLWFIRTMLGFIVIYPAIRWAVKKKWPAWIAGVGSLALVLLPGVEIGYYTMIYWMPVYLMGAYIAYWHKERFERVPQVNAGWKYAACAAAILLLNAVRPLHYALHYLFWLPVPLLMWALADGFARFPKLPWWAGTSFWLFVTHLLAEPFAVKLYLRVFGTGTVAFVLGNALLPLLTAAMTLACAAAARKICPRLYAFSTGMRPERN